MERRTRIVATLGPATDRPAVLENLLAQGVDVVRINFSHGRSEEPLARIRRVRELARQRSRPLAILADLPGPKLRALLHQPLRLVESQTVNLARTPEIGDIGLTEPEVLDHIQPGHRVLLDDGRLQLRVTGLTAERVALRVEVGGTLLPNKGINLPDTEFTIPALTNRDREALAVAAEGKVDWLALSFVRSPSAAQELRAAAHAVGLGVPILAKIERPEAVHCAADLIAAFDAIMIARGDLGVEIPLEQVPQVQKQLIRQARAAGKPVITATDMLDSMRDNPRPTRAEVSDVANAVYDGTDALMLSGETAIGQYPVEAVRCMASIAREAETHLTVDSRPGLALPRGDIRDHLTQATCELAKEINADAILTPTLSGRTAILVARHRPNTAIIAATPDDKVQRQLALVWGLTPILMPSVTSAGADRLEAAVQASFQQGAVQAGQRVVVLAGHPLEGGTELPTLRVLKVGPAGQSWAP